MGGKLRNPLIPCLKKRSQGTRQGSEGHGVWGDHERGGDRELLKEDIRNTGKCFRLSILQGGKTRERPAALDLVVITV